ncbi:MAG: metallophosphoesterase family protein [Chloroflexales bacterium]|nr:metallophosphoesterase family protein [Chloroflexales bacterium]
MAVVGLVADIHGDLAGLRRALAIFAREQVARLICAGDIVDRGADADAIVPILARLGATGVKGNHEHTVLYAQERWRASPRAAQLAQVGRVVSDATIGYIAALPATARLTLAGVRILVAHGAPWSDIASVFPDSHQAIFDQLRARYAADTDVIVLGHTHCPMQVDLGGLRVLNPGSVYGVTARDSATCATLDLATRTFRVFDLCTGAERPVERAAR